MTMKATPRIRTPAAMRLYLRLLISVPFRCTGYRTLFSNNCAARYSTLFSNTDAAPLLYALQQLVDYLLPLRLGPGAYVTLADLVALFIYEECLRHR